MTSGSCIDLTLLQLRYTKNELESYTESRKTGLSHKSINWIQKSSVTLWNLTEGVISKTTIDLLRVTILQKYQCESSKAKVLSFTLAFLKYLSSIKLDLRYKSFEIFLEKPRVIRSRKNVTDRIITRDDINTVLSYIQNCETAGSLSNYRANQYKAFVLFGAYTGQRSMATMSKLTVGQVRETLTSTDKPCILVESTQDKIKMAHYVPVHPTVLKALDMIVKRRKASDPLFEYNSVWMWMKRQKIRLSRLESHFVLGDLRKFAEQHGDIIGWDQSNRAYILTHGVSGVDWAHYKHPLPENVYDVYMKAWGGG